MVDRVRHASPVKTKSPQNAVARAYVGCSGWAYASWKPDFYPAKLPSKKLLEYYATQLNSVEVNYTFRSLPTRAMVENWLAQTGHDFRFSFKAPQRITHIRRLRECGAELKAFAAAIEPVAAARRLGLILFQLPPNFRADAERLAAFLKEARGLRLRLAFEFRHESWFDPGIYGLLERHKAALCVAESDELSTPDVATAPFACYRLRKSEYSAAALKAIRERLAKSARSGDVFAYFKHEEEPTGAVRAVQVLSALTRRSR
ncbi:MAG: DUF72 domain-containing protein [Acidobacteriaceae bacterium]|jgi:uncharacterized protein YecE (DUF72 family)